MTGGGGGRKAGNGGKGNGGGGGTTGPRLRALKSNGAPAKSRAVLAVNAGNSCPKLQPIRAQTRTAAKNFIFIN